MVGAMRLPGRLREDIIEINTHGGDCWATNEILQLVTVKALVWRETWWNLQSGPFLNGRVDLTQAEAVAGHIRAKTAKAGEYCRQTVDRPPSDLTEHAPRDPQYPGLSWSTSTILSTIDVGREAPLRSFS